LLIAKRYAARIGQTWDEKNARAPLEVCLDPQFHIYKQFIRQKPPAKQASSIYEEVDPEKFLDLYGNILPTRVEFWGLGPAVLKRRFLDD
jgi:hypothetical protein